MICQQWPDGSRARQCFSRHKSPLQAQKRYAIRYRISSSLGRNTTRKIIASSIFTRVRSTGQEELYYSWSVEGTHLHFSDLNNFSSLLSTGVSASRHLCPLDWFTWVLLLYLCTVHCSVCWNFDHELASSSYAYILYL